MSTSSHPYTKEIVKRLCDQHLRRYTGMLERARGGQSGYREKELVELITVWRKTEADGYDYDRLSTRCREEVRDSYEDEFGPDGEDVVNVT